MGIGDGSMGELTLPRPHMFCNDGHDIGVKNGGNILAGLSNPFKFASDVNALKQVCINNNVF